MNPLHDPIDRLLATIQSRGQRNLARLEATPKIQHCPTCGHNALLDEKSLWEDDGSDKEPVYVCPPCTQAEKAKRFAAKLRANGIPADVHTATLDNFDTNRPRVNREFHSPAEFLAKARDFEAGRVRNLILSGTPGIGKGHLAAALAIAALRAGKRIEWHETAQLFRDFHRAYATDSTGAVIAPLVRCDLLVLDEVALRALPADGEEILFAILDPRHKAKRQTVLLSNKPGPEIRAWFGERIMDRLLSGRLGYLFGEWESMRGSAGDGGF